MCQQQHLSQYQCPHFACGYIFCDNYHNMFPHFACGYIIVISLKSVDIYTAILPSLTRRHVHGLTQTRKSRSCEMDWRRRSFRGAVKEFCIHRRSIRDETQKFIVMENHVLGCVVVIGVRVCVVTRELSFYSGKNQHLKGRVKRETFEITGGGRLKWMGVLSERLL